MFDTHCHLNFKSFNGEINKIVLTAKESGVSHINIPGTDVESSENAVKIANDYENIFASVGIHPHHVFKYQIAHPRHAERPQRHAERPQRHAERPQRHPELDSGSAQLHQIPNQVWNDMGQVWNDMGQVWNDKGENSENDVFSFINSELEQIEKLAKEKSVVAIGEIGLDRHYYSKTKYKEYEISENFMSMQKDIFVRQIDIAFSQKKSLVLHNREAGVEFLESLSSVWRDSFQKRTVFHCCEADKKLLDFAKTHNIFIGVDGDVTYNKEKEDFIKQVPLDMLVLETDSPFLTPEPQRSIKKFPNEPKNLDMIADFISNKLSISKEELIKHTFENSIVLFNLN